MHEDCVLYKFHPFLKRHVYESKISLNFHSHLKSRFTGCCRSTFFSIKRVLGLQSTVRALIICFTWTFLILQLLFFLQVVRSNGEHVLNKIIKAGKSLNNQDYKTLKFFFPRRYHQYSIMISFFISSSSKYHRWRKLTIICNNKGKS